MDRIYRPLFISLLILSAFVLVLPAYAQDEEAEATSWSQEDMMNPTYAEDTAVLRTYLEALVAGDFDAARATMADDMTMYGPAADESETPDEVIQRWTQTQADFSSMGVEFVTHSWVVPSGDLEGRWVGAWGTWTGTHAASEKEMRVPFHFVAQVENGKIIQSRGYRDRLAPNMAIGATVAAE